MPNICPGEKYASRNLDSAWCFLSHLGIGECPFGIVQHPAIEGVICIGCQLKKPFGPMHLLLYVIFPNDFNHVLSPFLEPVECIKGLLQYIYVLSELQVIRVSH